MKLMLFGLLCLAAIVAARPKYLAIPLDDVEVVEVADIAAAPSRFRRAAPEQEAWQLLEIDVAPRLPRHAKDDHDDGGRFQRSHGHDHDHVDYGAHTGHHGAFGWYADFPVLKH